MLVSSPDMGPGSQEKRREKVTRLGWAGSEPASAFSALQQSTSLKANTHHKNRKKRQKEKGSFLGVRQTEMQREAPGRLGVRPAKWWKATEPPHTSPFQPSLLPACSCLCCKNPEKSGTGLSGEWAGVQAAWWISAASELHAQDPSAPGCGGGRGGRGGGGWAPGWGPAARRGASLEWKELPARISVFRISYCQQPISPARGPCQCDKRAAAADSPSWETGQSPVSTEVCREWHFTLLSLADNTCSLLKTRSKALWWHPPLRKFLMHLWAPQTWNPP